MTTTRRPLLVLALFQLGLEMSVAGTPHGFVPGGAVEAHIIAGMHEVQGKIELIPASGAAGYRLRCLRSLVYASGDSYAYLRSGDHIVNVTAPAPDTPWARDISDLILRHFTPELLRYMPQGVWHLGLCGGAELY